MNETSTFIFKMSRSFYVIVDNNEEEAWETLSRKLSRSLERTKAEAKLLSSIYNYGFVKLKI